MASNGDDRMDDGALAGPLSRSSGEGDDPRSERGDCVWSFGHSVKLPGVVRFGEVTFEFVDRDPPHDQVPLVSGITEVVDWCREQRLVPLLAALAWEPVGLYLCERFGLYGTCGPSLEVLEGRHTGEVTAHSDEYTKRD